MKTYKRNGVVLTTGQIAAGCCVAPRTVCKWIDRGELRGWRIPGSHDRRVSIEDFAAFIAEHGVTPQGKLRDILAQRSTRLVVVTDDERLFERFKFAADRLSPASPIGVVQACNAFAAGQCAAERPLGVAVDLRVAGLPCIFESSVAPILAMVSVYGPPEWLGAIRSRVWRTLPVNVDEPQLVEALRDLRRLGLGGSGEQEDL
jgi:hypothetical protein